MKRVIVFFNFGPAVMMSLLDGVTSIRREYPNGQEIQLQIMSAGFPSLTDDSMVVHVASDRTLSSHEILEAANKLL